jgi:hypothetical protein
VTTVARRLAIVLLALMAAACALTNTGDPSVAATVGDTRVETAEIDRLSEAITSAPANQQQNPMAVQLELVTFFVRSAVFEHVAARNDVQVTDEQVDTAVEAQVEQAGGREAFEQGLRDQGLPEDLFLELVRGQQLQTALEEEAGGDLLRFVLDQSADLQVEINPRYGEWDANSLSVQSSHPIAGPTELPAAAPGQ